MAIRPLPDYIRVILYDTDGVAAPTVPVSITGVATSAKQDTGNTSLASIDAKLASAVALSDVLSNPTTLPVIAWLTAFDGTQGVRLRVQVFRVDMATVAIGSIATVWTPTSGKKFRLMGGSFSVSAAVSVLFEDNSAGAGNFIWRTPKLLADTPYNFDLGNGKLSAAANNVLKATASASANILGVLYGTEE